MGNQWSKELDCDTIAISGSKGIAHVKCNDGKEYAKALRHFAGGAVKPGELLPWDSDFEDAVYGK
jgi:hypothetical protein